MGGLLFNEVKSSGKNTDSQSSSARIVAAS
jgi:hypothetical protein